MSRASRIQDLACIFRSLQLIAEESIKLQQGNIKFYWENSDVRRTVQSISCKQSLKEWSQNTSQYGDIAKETTERLSAVFQGLVAYNNVSNAGKLFNY